MLNNRVKLAFLIVLAMSLTAITTVATAQSGNWGGGGIIIDAVRFLLRFLLSLAGYRGF